MHRLVPHPDFPPARVEQVAVSLEREGREWSLGFAAAGARGLVLPARAAAARADGLWQTTCFELFVKPAGGEGYFEFNLSPSTAWAAYRFDGHRAGRRDWETAAPRIERRANGIAAALDMGGLPGGAWRVGLSAVIEEVGGVRSYWALAHPPGDPDFHHDACFALALAAPSGA